MSEQKCWGCKKACGACSWSQYGVHEPIENWDATPVIVEGEVRSYKIRNCPEFEPDDKPYGKSTLATATNSILSSILGRKYRRYFRSDEQFKELIKLMKEVNRGDV